MAEPLSLAASVIALGQAANGVSKVIRRVWDLRTAPKRLLETHNKAEELRALAKIAATAAESSSITDQEAIFRFQRLVVRAKDVLNDAQTIIICKLVKNPESLDNEGAEIKIRKLRFLRGETALAGINARLSDVLQAMHAALASISAVETLRLRVTLDSVQCRLVQFDDRHRPLSGTTTPRVYEIDDTAPESAPILAPPPASVEGATPPSRQQLVAHGDVPFESTAPSSTTPLLQVEMTLAEGLLDICGCSCHTPVAVRTPSWLGDAVGRLLIRWYRSPETCEKCSLRACRAGRKRMLSTQYFFPWWLMRRLVEFQSGWSSSKGLGISLRTTNIIPDDSTVFLFAQHNNIDGIKRLFEQKLASPFDVSLKGRTPLHFAATAVQAEMIEFLVKQKAETDVEDHDHLSPNDIIWELYLRNPTKRRFILDAAELSPSNTESLEKQCFTGLHRIVLGLGSSVDLDAYLKINSSEIDKQDLTGKTALAWAASRKDPRPVRTLLKHGASPRIADYRSKTPLHYCAGSGDPEAVQIILEAIRQRNELQPGSEKSVIEAGDDKRRTPLNYATRMNLYPHTKLLVDYGADLEATESKTKRTILLNAVYWNSHEVLPLLLNRGARTDVRDSRSETLLHHIARFGDVETLRIMAEHDLGYIDVDAANVLGLTALDIFNSADARCSPEEGSQRELAAGLFSTILRNAAQASRGREGRPGSERVQEVDGDEEVGDAGTTEAEEKVRQVTTVINSVCLDDDDDDYDDSDGSEVFYDALMEIASEA